MKTLDEKVKIHTSALEKAIVHSLIFGEHKDDFRMVLGMFGGKIEKEEVLIFKTISISVGSEMEVSMAPEDYVRTAEISEELYEDDMFIVGWYTSISKNGTFFTNTNRINQLGWQTDNAKAIAIVIYPEHIKSNDFKKIVKIYRIRDIDLNISSSDNWIDLNIELIDFNDNENNLIFGILSKYQSIKESIKIRGIENVVLDDFLDEKLNEEEILLLKQLLEEAEGSFSRLHINEIMEKSGIIDAKLVIKTIQKMIEDHELKAKYFNSSNFVAFHTSPKTNKIDDFVKKINNKNDYKKKDTP